MQDFGATFNLTYHNGAPVADMLKKTTYSYFWALSDNLSIRFIFQQVLANTVNPRYQETEFCRLG